MSFGIASSERGFVLFVVKSALAGRCNFAMTLREPLDGPLPRKRVTPAQSLAAADSSGCDGRHKKALFAGAQHRACYLSYQHAKDSRRGVDSRQCKQILP